MTYSIGIQFKLNNTIYIKLLFYTYRSYGATLIHLDLCACLSSYNTLPVVYQLVAKCLLAIC